VRLLMHLLQHVPATALMDVPAADKDGYEAWLVAQGDLVNFVATLQPRHQRLLGKRLGRLGADPSVLR